jgi:hypothetical protein
METTMTLQDLSELLHPGPGNARTFASAALHAVSRTLASWAWRLAAPQAKAPAVQVTEFHCEAGAPEGALFVNGQLVGRISGVTRL